MSEVSEAARQLKALRERAGLSMREVAESLGWALTRYQHYEDRYRRRVIDNLQRRARYFGLTLVTHPPPE